MLSPTHAPTARDMSRKVSAVNHNNVNISTTVNACNLMYSTSAMSYSNLFFDNRKEKENGETKEDQAIFVDLTAPPSLLVQPELASTTSEADTNTSHATSTTLSASHKPTPATFTSTFTTATEAVLSSTEFNGERKEEEEEEDQAIFVDLTAPPSLLVQPELLPKAYWNQMGMIKRRGHLEQHWVVIYAFLDLSFADRLKMQSYCRLFHKVEKLLTLNKHHETLLKPLPLSLWTSFPHPKYSKFDNLIRRLNQVRREDPEKAPSIVFVLEGSFHSADYSQVTIRYPLKIIGAGQNKTFLSNYSFRIANDSFVPTNQDKVDGTKKDNMMEHVELSGMTVCDVDGSGLYTDNSTLFFLCEKMKFIRCLRGVAARNAKGRLINCVIAQCKDSGIFSDLNTLIEVEGNQTKIIGNVTSGSSYQFGLNTCCSSSKIHLLAPLTKESCSMFNSKGQNYGSHPLGDGGGSIETVDSF